MLPRTTQQSYSAALVRESQIEPWLAFANTLLAGAKSSHGTTQPKMNPQPDLRSGTKVDAAEKGLDVRKKTFLGIREKCFFLTSPFIEPGAVMVYGMSYVVGAEVLVGMLRLCREDRFAILPAALCMTGFMRISGPLRLAGCIRHQSETLRSPGTTALERQPRG
jgi:hypothetical protein